MEFINKPADSLQFEWLLFWTLANGSSQPFPFDRFVSSILASNPKNYFRMQINYSKRNEAAFSHP